MNILKPQKLNFYELKNKYLIDINEGEEINYCNFQNEKCNDIILYDIEFEHCNFNNICMQKGKLEKITFRDVIFEQCDFSNTEFEYSFFIRCQFNNCKVSGCNFIENRLYNVTFIETNASYINLAMASIENVLFKDSNLRNSYFQETTAKNIEGYQLVEVDGKQAGKFTIEPITVTYYYLYKTKATVQYIDKITGQILEQSTTEGLEGDNFVTESKDFENYILVEEPAEKTVKMTKEEQILKYYYIHISGGVIEKHIEVDKY